MRKRIAVLGSLAAVAVSVLAWAAPAEGFGGRELKGRMRGAALRHLVENTRLQQEVGLSAAQLERLRDIHRNSTLAAIESRTQLRSRQLELGDLLRASNPDRVAVDRKIEEISALRATQMKDGIQVRLAVRELLTPEQNTRLREIGAQAIRGRQNRVAQRRWLRRTEAQPKSDGVPPLN